MVLGLGFLDPWLTSWRLNKWILGQRKVWAMLWGFLGKFVAFYWAQCSAYYKPTDNLHLHILSIQHEFLPKSSLQES